MDERKLTIAALERKAGLKLDAVRNIILGRTRNPNVQVLQAIARVFNCSIEELTSFETFQENIVNPLQNAYTKELKFDNPELLLDAVKVIVQVLDEKNLSLTLTKVLLLIQEVYHFSSKKNINIADPEFVEWIIERL